MITRKELISSKEYWLVKFQNSLFEQVEKYLKDNKVSKTEFSKKLGVSKGYVSQILNGDFDHKVSKLIELSLAIGMVPFLHFENLDNCIFLDSIDALDTVHDSKISINITINFNNHIKIDKQCGSNTGILKKQELKSSILFNPFQLQQRIIGLA